MNSSPLGFIRRATRMNSSPLEFTLRAQSMNSSPLGFTRRAASMDSIPLHHTADKSAESQSRRQLCPTADMTDPADMSAVAHRRKVCCVTQETGQLHHTADMSAALRAGRIRAVNVTT